MKKIKFSILSTGTIAHQMARTVSQMPEIELYAVASRTLETAQEFKQEYGFVCAYGDYEELANDPQSDIVYVGTPHHRHAQDTRMLLLAGHHVLCEKPITVNRKLAEELFSLAKTKKLVLVDATWMRYMPFISMAKQAAIRHNLGSLKTINSALGISKTHAKRMIDPELAGGALLDVGIYPINMALVFANSKVKDVISVPQMYHTGVDESSSIILTFENNIMASLQTSLNAIMSPKTSLNYEKGRIELDDIPNPSTITIYDDEQQELEVMRVPEQISGYEYEVREMIQCIHSGNLETPTYTHEKSLEVLSVMDELRRQWNLIYPFERN